MRLGLSGSCHELRICGRTDGETQAVFIEGTGGTGIPPKHRVGSPRIITMTGNLALPLAFGTRYEFPCPSTARTTTPGSSASTRQPHR